MDTLDLTKRLIAIPSFVDTATNEKSIGEFIFQYLKQFPFLTVEKQMVKDGRFNIIARDNFPTRLLFNGHIDTVQPKTGWITNQYKATSKGGRLYGLGAADMKGNVAAILSSLENFQETKGLMMLFYIDEEYDFLGMKEFIKKYKNKINPTYIISGDGNDLTITNGCRGLIEITCATKGLSGHASRPELGRNAILRSVKSVTRLSTYLGKNYATKELGKTTCNLAFLEGGLDLGNVNNQRVFGREGNNIADIAEFVLDIRTGSIALDAKTIIKLLKKFLEEKGLVLEQVTIRHDLKPWITTKQQMKVIEKSMDKISLVKYKNPGTNGYVDAQMLWEAFNKAPTLTFGAGKGTTCHKSNEYIEVKELEKVTNIYTNLMREFANGKDKTL